MQSLEEPLTQAEQIERAQFLGEIKAQGDAYFAQLAEAAEMMTAAEVLRRAGLFLRQSARTLSGYPSLAVILAEYRASARRHFAHNPTFCEALLSLFVGLETEQHGETAAGDAWPAVGEWVN